MFQKMEDQKERTTHNEWMRSFFQKEQDAHGRVEGYCNGLDKWLSTCAAAIRIGMMPWQLPPFFFPDPGPKVEIGNVGSVRVNRAWRWFPILLLGLLLGAGGIIVLPRFIGALPVVPTSTSAVPVAASPDTVQFDEIHESRKDDGAWHHNYTERVTYKKGPDGNWTETDRHRID